MIFPKQFLDFIQTLYSEWYKVMNTCPKNSFWKGVLGKDDPSSSGLALLHMEKRFLLRNKIASYPNTQMTQILICPILRTLINV